MTFELGVCSFGNTPRLPDGSRGPTAQALRDVLEAIKLAGVAHDVKEYPAAGHSFLNDADNAPRPLRPLTRIAGIGPEPESAADAWRRIEAFFGEHLADS